MKYEVLKNPSIFYCFIEDIDVRTLYVEDNMITFECCENLDIIGTVRIAVLNLQSFEYEEVIFNNCIILDSGEFEFKNVYKIKIGNEDKEKIEKMHNLLDQIYNVENIFNETYNGKNDLLKSKKKNMEHYSYEDDKLICKNIEEQIEYWFDFPKSNVTLPDNVTLAFVASEYKIYQNIVNSSFHHELQNGLKKLNMDNIGLFKKEINHVYIGSDYCSNLFPNDKLLIRLINQAYDENLSMTICYPPLVQMRLEQVKESLRIIDEFCQRENTTVELAINDWGMLQLLKEENLNSFDLILGRLLNKRKKDPRMEHRMGYKKYKEWFGINNLCSEPFRKITDTYQISRYEFETTQFINEIPTGNHTLHFPFYQTNTASNCLIYANCKNKSALQQEYPENCPHYCSEFYFSFPKHLDVIGKNNSLFGFDKKIFKDQEIIDEYIKRGIDRFAYTPL